MDARANRRGRPRSPERESGREGADREEECVPTIDSKNPSLAEGFFVSAGISL
jgi:hypothetical protein